MEKSDSQNLNPYEDKTTLDTVALARQEREKQGTWEVEVSYGGEADLHRHYNDCKKNPGHLKFIPVDHFNMEHLPPACHDNDVLDLVRVRSDLTVRVSVKYVSEKRPETFPGSDIPYPFYSNRGSDMMRVGTGCISSVLRFPDKNGINKTCECKECLNSPTPKTQFAHIRICTAAHVVYDELEGAHAMCHLFFDRGGTPDVCKGVVTLDEVSEVDSKPNRDWCDVIFITHDLNLAERLDKMVQFCSHVEKKVFAKTQTGNFDFGPGYDIEESQTGTKIDPDILYRLIVIVSHPHGCSKQVSVGYSIMREEGGGVGMERLIYTTATCPGSSGACVFVLRCNMGLFYYWNYGVHSANYEGNKELNYCRLEL